MGGYLSMWLALRNPGATSRVLNLHSPGVVTARMRALDAAFRLPVAPRIVDWLAGRDPERWVFENVHYYDESLKSREEARAYAAPLRSREGRRAFARHLGDTLAVEPGQTQRIAFAAEHAGHWLIESVATDWAAPRFVRWYAVE